MLSGTETLRVKDFLFFFEQFFSVSVWYFESEIFFGENIVCICKDCGLSGESCVCDEVSRCVSCEHYDFVIGCTLEAPEDCIKEEV